MNTQKIHFIGIKGVGMTALAILALEKGYEVTGSDVEDTFVTDIALEKTGIVVTSFDAKNLQNKPDIVVLSAAYNKDNIEVKEARKKRLNIKAYSEILALFSSESQVIAVSGIHGKTTTTALISFLLTKANLNPSYVIGSGEIADLPASGHLGSGDYFVLEADEYRKSPDDNNSKFFDLNPQIEIITSIEMDHPDMFLTDEKVYEAFYKFACRIPRKGFIVLCLDYPKAKKLLRSLADRNFETYGFSEDVAWQIIDYLESVDSTSFSLINEGKNIGPFVIKIPGEGNVLNATAAVIVALKLGIQEKSIIKYLAEFQGVKRRFEKIGQFNDITVIDDYAHHPHSVALTLEAVKKRFPDAKIWCIFQPHTYSRTKELLSSFATAFNCADKVIITDIYASAREKEATITAEDLTQAIHINQKQVKYVSSWDKITQELIDNVGGKTVIITMGAGDIYKLGQNILKELKK
ncbi:MAG: UDP-N-acetylmuramate-L-alanine ligase [Berkelbacteria bacterium GW2011_GWA1_36_9]|uniref:UDP-N-acetylmuramate--L-alanine ligase n=2 Tax=Candidatus Berkelbacteria TaxID=1618330 RepID=A0A0G0IS61_9BACT|nr:MAG: UDP-N-acetylmuramate-L-alanine ligase [Berkelbacteria bacterium GW2011_GWA1_36_9]